MRQWTRWALLIVTLSGLVGCIEPYDDTRLQCNLWAGSGFDRTTLIVPTRGRRPGDEGYYSHYELHANIEGRGYVRLTNFLIQPSLHVTNPCLQFTEDQFCRDDEVYPCEPYVNMVSYEYLEDIFAVISLGATYPTADASNPYGYDHRPGYDFMTWPDHLFVDPLETNAATKLARSNLVQQEVETFCEWCLPEGYYLGNPLKISKPQRGTIHGTVDGPDPRTGAAVGGFELEVPGKLHGMTELLLIREPDTSRLSPENIFREDLLPSADSQVLLIARKDGSLGYIRDDVYRGVVSVFMVNPASLPLFMHMSVFGDLDEDPIGI